MATKYDLSLVPYDQLFAEFQRRYPGGVLTFLYQPDGKPPGLQILSSHWGGLAVALGLADYSHASIMKNLMDGNRVMPHGPLDPDSPPKPPPTVPQ